MVSMVCPVGGVLADIPDTHPSTPLLLQHSRVPISRHSWSHRVCFGVMASAPMELPWSLGLVVNVAYFKIYPSGVFGGFGGGGSKGGQIF